MKIALSNPGVGPFTQQAALALHDAELLDSYWTTFGDQPEASWRKRLVRVASCLGLDLDRELKRRAIDKIPHDIVRFSPYWEIIRTLLSRARLDPRIVDYVWEREILAFDSTVAKRAFETARGIYGYEYSALATFRAAAKRGLPRIYEVPSPEHGFVQGVIQREIEKIPELNDGTRDYFLRRQADRTARLREEWALADLVIANSTFTCRSYAAAGLDVTKVRIIPLGAEPVADCHGGSQGKGPLRVLCAGTLSIRKGTHYLLSAWREFHANGAAILEMYGADCMPAHITRELPPGCQLSASIPKVQLYERYRAADVLVFPTLCDGFGLVVTEAFAHGVPVIATENAGAADFVRHGENGLIVAPGDTQALVDALIWCADHRSELMRMRKAALETAARWQWSDYRCALANAASEQMRKTGVAW